MLSYVKNKLLNNIWMAVSLLIDSKALKKEGNQYYVLVLVGTSSVSKTYVKIGGQNAGSVWITEGLEEGQTLVIE